MAFKIITDKRERNILSSIVIPKQLQKAEGISAFCDQSVKYVKDKELMSPLRIDEEHWETFLSNLDEITRKWYSDNMDFNDTKNVDGELDLDTFLKKTDSLFGIKSILFEYENSLQEWKYYTEDDMYKRIMANWRETEKNLKAGEEKIFECFKDILEKIYDAIKYNSNDKDRCSKKEWSLFVNNIPHFMIESVNVQSMIFEFNTYSNDNNVIGLKEFKEFKEAFAKNISFLWKQ
eukprot:398983_1